jgi:hypothetical protein
MEAALWAGAAAAGAAAVVATVLATRLRLQDGAGGALRRSALPLAALWTGLCALILAVAGLSLLPVALLFVAVGLLGSVAITTLRVPRAGTGSGRLAALRRLAAGVPLVLALGAPCLFALLLEAAGLASPLPGLSGPLAIAAGALLAPATLLVIAGEILAGLFAAGARIDGRLRLLLGSQAGLVLVSAAVLGSGRWPALGAGLGSGLAVAMFVLALQYLYRTKELSPAVSRYLAAWTCTAMVLAAGWFLWAFEGSAPVLVVGVFAELALALGATLGTLPRNVGTRASWLLRPFWVFLFLVFTFLTEFFLGALLDLTVAGRGFLAYIPFVHPGGTPGAVANALLYNGLWFAAAILASAWFLVALGFTMGPLVLLKIRETREPAQRYRLGLTVAVYAIAAVYIPSFASSTPLLNIPALASLPVIGWGFGLRAGGPFEAGLSLAVLLMYLGVGVLTVLFGRKALCSVLCGAALMYQGTTMSEMREFNQTSKVGRHFLGSQLSTAYVVMSGVALVSLFAISLLAFLRLLPAVQVANGEFDSAALPLPIELYFGAVWFVMFVSTPYVGTYNCATTGFCHWGALSLPFARVGFFRLKVKDKKVCEACTTFDCAKACPVGLVDMPLFFRTKGEYRSSKCCGVGDCVGACPYGNMYHQDVRLWLRRRLGRAEPTGPNGAPVGVPLPMVRSGPSPGSLTPSPANARR